MKSISAVVLISGLIAIGCSPQTRDEYAQAGQEAGHAMKQDFKRGEKAADAATKAASSSLKDDGAGAKKAIDNLPDATMTPKIKAALASASNLHSAKIDVTTVGTAVTLGGTVPTADEKHRAAVIAAKTAGSNFKVKDDISVAKA